MNLCKFHKVWRYYGLVQQGSSLCLLHMIKIQMSFGSENSQQRDTYLATKKIIVSCFGQKFWWSTATGRSSQKLQEKCWNKEWIFHIIPAMSARAGTVSIRLIQVFITKPYMILYDLVSMEKKYIETTLQNINWFILLDSQNKAQIFY